MLKIKMDNWKVSAFKTIIYFAFMLSGAFVFAGSVVFLADFAYDWELSSRLNYPLWYKSLATFFFIGLIAMDFFYMDRYLFLNTKKKYLKFMDRRRERVLNNDTRMAKLTACKLIHGYFIYYVDVSSQYVAHKMWVLPIIIITKISVQEKMKWVMNHYKDDVIKASYFEINENYVEMEIRREHV